MLATIWSSPNTAETLFLIAAIVFFIEAVLILAARPQTARFTGLCMAAGAVLVSLGLLAL